MLGLVEQTVSLSRRNTARCASLLLDLEEYEREAFKAFLEYPTQDNLGTLVTYASVEEQQVERVLRALPDAVARKQGGKWHVTVGVLPRSCALGQ